MKKVFNNKKVRVLYYLSVGQFENKAFHHFFNLDNFPYLVFYIRFLHTISMKKKNKQTKIHTHTY